MKEKRERMSESGARRRIEGRSFRKSNRRIEREKTEGDENGKEKKEKLVTDRDTEKER